MGKRHKEDFRRTGYVLFLDLGVLFMSTLNLSSFTELYTYYLCIFLYDG